MWSIGLLSLAVAYLETAPLEGTRASAGTNYIPVTSRAVSFMAKQRPDEAYYVVESAAVQDDSASSWLLPLSAALAAGSAAALASRRHALQKKIALLSVGGMEEDQVAALKDKKVCFMFTGQGSQYSKMGKEYYE